MCVKDGTLRIQDSNHSTANLLYNYAHSTYVFDTSVLVSIVGSTMKRSSESALRVTISSVLLKVRIADTKKLLPEDSVGTVTVKLKKAVSTTSLMLSDGLHISPRKGNEEL